MSVYLVDYENNKNLLGINELSNDDYVIIFYSEKANTISFDNHKEILSSKAHFDYICVDVGGQNALDFQLSSYLGFLIKQNEDNECKFYIVSNDKGYSYIKSFWKKHKSIDIQLLTDLTGKPQNVSNENTKPVTKEVQAISTNSSKATGTLKNILKQSNLALTDKEIKEISAIATKYKTTTAINNNLNKLLKDSTKTGEILKLIKPFLKNKK